jgi:hypothetical protein
LKLVSEGGFAGSGGAGEEMPGGARDSLRHELSNRV